MITGRLSSEDSRPEATKEESDAMTFLFTTGFTMVGTNAGVNYLSEDTGSGVIVASTAEPYSDETIRRLLRAKAGPVVRAPDDPDEFLVWLEK